MYFLGHYLMKSIRVSFLGFGHKMDQEIDPAVDQCVEYRLASDYMCTTLTTAAMWTTIQLRFAMFVWPYTQADDKWSTETLFVSSDKIHKSHIKCL